MRKKVEILSSECLSTAHISFLLIPTTTAVKFASIGNNIRTFDMRLLTGKSSE